MDNAASVFGDLPQEYLTDDYIIIPGLPAPMPRDRDEWMAWVPQILAHRELTAARCASDFHERAVQKALCRQPHGLGQAYLAITFGWIYEPRDDDDFVMVPLILYPRQAELLFAIDACMCAPKGPRASIAIPKARAVGATWICALDDVVRWLTRKHYQARIVSRTEDMVDKTGSSDCWMWKYDFLLKHLPGWMLPEGYSQRSRYRTHMTILNPVTGSAILGEATTTGIGVGGRAAKYSLDEGSRFRGLASTWGQLGETTNHRVICGTHKTDESTAFWDLCHGLNGWEKPIVFEMPWDSVLTRDHEWLEATRQTMTPELFQREIMMNPWAGVSTWVYPVARTKSPSLHFGYRPDQGSVLHGLDDGWDDEFGCTWAQYEPKQNRLIILDGYQNSHQTLSFYGHLLKGELAGRYDWDMEARRIARWISENRTWRGLYYGDRHGDNTELGSGESVWDRLQRVHGIHVNANPPLLNDLKGRRESLNELMPDLECADTPGAAMVLEALQQHRFPSKRGDTEPLTEYRKPQHSQFSHLSTAMEYIAVHLVSKYGDGPKTTPQRRNNDWLQPGRDPYGRAPNQAYTRAPERARQRNTWIH